MFYSRVNDLCTEHGVKITNVISEIGMGSGNLSKWKSGVVPKADTLSKLADYFNVSTDYLLGRTDDREKEPASGDGGGLDEKQRMVYERLLKLTPENLEIAIGQLDVLLTLQEKRDKN